MRNHSKVILKSSNPVMDPLDTLAGEDKKVDPYHTYHVHVKSTNFTNTLACVCICSDLGLSLLPIREPSVVQWDSN